VRCVASDDGWFSPAVITNAAVAAIGFVALLVQGGLTLRALRHAKRSADAAFASAWATSDEVQISKAAFAGSQANAETANTMAEQSFALAAEHAKATQLAAKATLRSAEATESAILDVERPRLAVILEALNGWESDARSRLVFLQAQPDLPLIRKPTGRCRIVNYGRMPAWVEARCVAFKVLPRPIPEQPSYNPEDVSAGLGVPIAPMSLDPNSHELGIAELTITPREQEKIGRDVDAVFYGRIEYRGIFKDTLYVTSFCFRVAHYSGGWDAGPPTWIKNT